jgi:hypothetical protein
VGARRGRRGVRGKARRWRQGEVVSSVAPSEASSTGPHRWRQLVSGECSSVEASGGSVGPPSGGVCRTIGQQWSRTSGRRRCSDVGGGGVGGGGGSGVTSMRRMKIVAPV